MSERATPVIAPRGWVEALEESRADLAAGRVVPALPIIEELFAAFDALERELGVLPDEPQLDRVPPAPPR